MNHKFPLTSEHVEMAQRLRIVGWGWRRIAARIGCSEGTLRTHLRNLLAPPLARPGKPPLGHWRGTRAEEMRVLETVPLDTRSRHAKWMGDPIPGRSALDQMRVYPR